MNAMKLFWGLLVVIAGTLLILINQGIVDSSIWLLIASMWPILLVVVGLRLIIRDEKALSTSVLAVLLLSTLFVAITFQNSPTGGSKSDFMGFHLNTAVYNEDLKDSYDANLIKNLDLTVSTGAARINVYALTADAAPGTLYQIKSRDMGKLSVVRRDDGTKTSLVVEESTVGLRMGQGMMNREITLYLPPSLITDLNLSSGASKLSLDFSALQMQKATLSVGASSGIITLGEKTPRQSLSLSAGASSLVFRVPANLGVKATLEGGLNSVNTESTTIAKSGDSYVSKDFDAAISQMVISGSTGASSIKFEAIQ